MSVSRFRFSDELAEAILPVVQFDGLCLQAGDAECVAAFWAVALGGKVSRTGQERWRVDSAPGRPAKEFIRVTAVRGGSPVPTRVHLDICLPGGDPQHLLDAGAALRRAPGTDPWYVMADPEGNEFCAYPAVDERPPGVFQLVTKSADAHSQARWWARLLGGTAETEGEAAAVVGAPGFPWDYMAFDPVPEPKLVASRMHWHVQMREGSPDKVIDAGATLLRKPEPAAPQWVFADPEGNEFCATAYGA